MPTEDEAFSAFNAIDPADRIPFMLYADLWCWLRAICEVLDEAGTEDTWDRMRAVRQDQGQAWMRDALRRAARLSEPLISAESLRRLLEGGPTEPPPPPAGDS